LKFTPAPNASGAAYAAFTFQVQDDGGTANGGVDLDQTPRTMTVNVTSVNDAPVGTNNTVTVLEDTAYTFTSGDFGFTDPSDSPANSLLAVKVTTLPGAGTLTLSGVAVTAGQFVSAANIAAGNLKFTPAANANGAAYSNFTFQVQDNGGTANGGVDLDQTPRTMTVNVTSVNDAPVGTNNTVTTLEDTTYTFTSGDFGFTDPSDAPANSLLAVKVTTLPGAGSLTLSGVAVTAGQFVSAANIAAGNLKFAPAPNANGAGYSSFTFQVQDNGGTANGGVDLDPTPKTVTVNVTSVNDAPAGTNNTVTTLEDTSYTFTTGDFGFTDPSDAPTNSLLAVKITTLPGAGSLTLSGVAVTAGQFVSAANIAAGNLKFTPAANANGAAYTAFTFQVQDDGGTANGGGDLDPTPKTMTVNVTSVNDAPVGTNNTITTLEDTSYTFTTSDFGFNDPSDSPANSLVAVKITTLPGAGTLTLSGVAVTAGQFVSAANIIAGNLKFAPAPNANGAAYTAFTFQVQDGGGTANGGVDLDQTPRTITVNVSSVNDAPVGTNNTVTTLEDTSYTFTTGDFGFNDPNDAPANTLLAVKITTLPGAGGLSLSGVAVTAGQSVSAANIAAGNLKFTPAANANGAAYTAFTFQVQDNGGTANGGVDLDQRPRTITVNVYRSSTPPPVVASVGVVNGPDSRVSPAVTLTISVSPVAPSPQNPENGLALPPPPPIVGRVPTHPPGSGHPPVAQPGPRLDAAPEHLERNAYHSSLPALIETHYVFNVRSLLLAQPNAGLTNSDFASGFTAGSMFDTTSSSTHNDPGTQDEHKVITLANAFRLTGIAVSAGFVAWAIRGTGLLTSVLASTPAWRHLDPMPVLAPEEEKPIWTEEDDREVAREENAASRLWQDEKLREPDGSGS
jgi:hypothetical protein